MGLTIEQYRRILSQSGNTMGQALKAQSDVVMEATWNRDINTRTAYIYDFFHDDSLGTIRGIKSDESPYKTPVSIKFITVQHGTISRDQVEYHVQFRPSHECPLPYYAEDYDQRYTMEYPIGLYIDIPDERGVYRKWLICSRSYDNQFLKYSVLPCNYTFRWVSQEIVYAMDGVARLRNSYNSGVWTDYLTTTVENQDQLWLPLNWVSTTLYYDKRLLISPPIPVPTAWQVSKVETMHPIGIYKAVVRQDLFNENDDLVDMKQNLLIADYYKSNALPTFAPSPISLRQNIHCRIEDLVGSEQIKVGGIPHVFVLKLSNWNGDDQPLADVPGLLASLSWTVYIGEDPVEEDDGRLVIVWEDDGSISVKAVDPNLIDSTITLEVTGQINAETPQAVYERKEVEVVGL